MAKFELAQGLSFNREKIADPAEYARENGCNSWLYLCGEEFAGMEGGMSYEQVQVLDRLDAAARARLAITHNRSALSAAAAATTVARQLSEGGTSCTVSATS